MSLLDMVSDLINMRSFGNLWYWILLALVWSWIGQRVLGAPWDMVLKAQKTGDEAVVSDVAQLIRIHVDRRLRIMDESGLIMVGLAAFVLTSLGLLAFVYDSEFAQAVVLLVFPLMLVSALSLRTARIMRARDLDGPALVKAAQRLRLQGQLIGMVSIFVTAMWGMYQNMTANVLG